MVSRSALIVAASLEFKEILGWRGVVAPKLTDVYANVLKTNATNTEDKLLAIILTGQIEEVVDISGKTEISLLSKTTEGLAKELVINDQLRLNILAVINNRPDILSLFTSETFGKFKLYDNNISFLKNEKLDLLLKHFRTSKDYKDFSDKIKTGDRFTWCFNNNEKIISSWNHVSDVELQDFPTAEKVVEIYNNSTKNWKINLNNFKEVIRLMDNDSFRKLIPIIVNEFNANSFYCEVATIAQESLIEKQLGNNITLLELQKLHYNAPDVEQKISNIKRKIIERFLK
jgi:hypothetical protein